jgi:hypothetical protein
MPPAVGYADTSSATELPIHIAMHEPMNQHHTAVAGPPAARGDEKVAGTEPSTPRIEMAYDTVDHFENSRRSSCREQKDRVSLYQLQPLIFITCL